MSFTPKFMRFFKRFDRERRALRSLKEWNEFRERWFDRENWPEKPGKAQGAEWAKRHKLVSRIRDGRRWAPGLWTIDLTPEARYQYFWTLWTIGAPLEDSRWELSRRIPELGWRRQCGYCDISTQDAGASTCPVCRRELYWTWIAD